MSALKAVEDMSPEEQADAELLDRLKAEHPDEELVLFRSGTCIGVFRSPPYKEWKRFRAMFLNEASRADALETLVLGCVVFPTAAELRASLQRRPALFEGWGNRLAAAAGMGAEVVEKK